MFACHKLHASIPEAKKMVFALKVVSFLMVFVLSLSAFYQ
jgi:hypothetical protein